MRRELDALTKSGKTFGARSFYNGDTDVITWSCQSVRLRNSRSLARHWQTQLSDTTADSTSLLNQAHVQYQSGTGGSTVEKPAETQTSIRLACHLVRAPNSRSGEHEFETPMRRELGALTKSGLLGSGLSTNQYLTFTVQYFWYKIAITSIFYNFGFRNTFKIFQIGNGGTGAFNNCAGKVWLLRPIKYAKTTFETVCKISSQAWSMFPGAFDPSIWGAVYGGCNYR
jgi:hypothetical protein